MLQRIVSTTQKLTQQKIVFGSSISDLKHFIINIQWLCFQLTVTSLVNLMSNSFRHHRTIWRILRSSTHATSFTSKTSGHKEFCRTGNKNQAEIYICPGGHEKFFIVSKLFFVTEDDCCLHCEELQVRQVCHLPWRNFVWPFGLLVALKRSQDQATALTAAILCLNWATLSNWTWFRQWEVPFD